MGTALNTLFRTIHIDADTTGTSMYTAKDSLSSTTTITATATVQFKAGNCIELLPGLEVKAGGEFLATIEACTPPSSVNFELPNLERKESFSTATTFQVFPNPAIEQMDIILEIVANSEEKSIYLFDLLGRSIQQILPSTVLPQGRHQFQFQVQDLPSATYFVVVKGINTIEVQKLSLMKE